jgi:hypothetical protein
VSVPTHRASCQTWAYRTKCWHCGKTICVVQCTCGSAVLFESLGWPWPEHCCRGIGGSGLSGWLAVDVLRANGVAIERTVMRKVFPPAEIKKPCEAPPVENMKAVQPTAGEQVTLLAVVRDLFTETKRTEWLNSLGALGASFLHLPRGRLWQATLVVNSESTNLTYTCIVPERLGLPRDAENKMVFARLEAQVAGAHAIWLATDIRLV